MQKPTIPSSTMLTPEQAAARLGIAPSTLGIWRSTGRYDLPYIKAGSRVRYRAGDVEKFIQSRTRNSYAGPSGGFASARPNEKPDPT